MPWTIADVDEHKKGLSDKQKEQWVAVANSTLSKCIADGESDCEAYAIRQANVVINKDFMVIRKDFEKQIIYGIAIEPDVVDAQDQFINKEDIEEAAHEYLVNHRNIKLSHGVNITKEVDVVESYIAPVEFTVNDVLIKEGTWIVALKINNEELWKETATNIVGLSVGGTCILK